MSYTSDQLSEILNEIASFEVELAEDPTLPTLGSKYLQSSLAQCRKYMNRVMYYIQTIGKQAKDLSVDVRMAEMDLELKVAQKLADDPLVKKQPSIEDRKALASMLLKEEYDNLKTMRVELLDATETLKIVKMKHQDLVRTNTDIKAQRQIVKDDIDSRLSGSCGYDKPYANQDRTVPGGMPPPVAQGRIDPRDLLDPDKRPDDMPEPVDEMHAKQIVDFYGDSIVLNQKKQILHTEPAEPASAYDNSDVVDNSCKKIEYDDANTGNVVAMDVFLGDI